MTLHPLLESRNKFLSTHAIGCDGNRFAGTEVLLENGLESLGIWREDRAPGRVACDDGGAETEDVEAILSHSVVVISQKKKVKR